MAEENIDKVWEELKAFILEVVKAKFSELDSSRKSYAMSLKFEEYFMNGEGKRYDGNDLIDHALFREYIKWLGLMLPSIIQDVINEIGIAKIIKELKEKIEKCCDGDEDPDTTAPVLSDIEVSEDESTGRKKVCVTATDNDPNLTYEWSSDCATFDTPNKHCSLITINTNVECSVCVKVCDGAGNCTTKCVNVSNDTPSLNISLPSTVEKGNSVKPEVSVVNMGDGITYEWSSDCATFDNAGVKTPFILFDKVGSCQVCLKGCRKDGVCLTECIEVEVTDLNIFDESKWIKDNIFLHGYYGCQLNCGRIEYIVDFKDSWQEGKTGKELYSTYAIANSDSGEYLRFNQGFLEFDTWDSDKQEKRNGRFLISSEVIVERRDGTHIAGTADGKLHVNVSITENIDVTECYFVGAVKVTGCQNTKGVVEKCLTSKMEKGHFVYQGFSCTGDASESPLFDGGNNLYRFVMSTDYGNEVFFANVQCSKNLYRIEGGVIKEEIICS